MSETETIKPRHLTSRKVDFIESKTKEQFAYILDCYDKTRTEGNNVLQWLFGVILGGLAMFGTLFKEGYWPIAWGAFAASAWATYLSIYLVRGLNPKNTMPPGNLAATLNKRLADSEEEMRWFEATLMDYRIGVNREAANEAADSVSRARTQLTYLPGVFIAGIALSAIFYGLWRGAVLILTVNQ